MQVFKQDGQYLKKLEEKPVVLERDLQRLCEANLEPLFGLQLVASEFTVRAFRIDTLAFDPENSAFVIIEYKRGASTSVVDQGFSYLSLMLDYQAEFVLKLNEQLGLNYGKKDVDWSRSRVFFVSPGFTAYQKNAVNFRDLPIDLWEVKVYADLVILSHVDSKPQAASLETLGLDQDIQNVTRVAGQHSVEQHLKDKPQEIRALYDTIRNMIVTIDPDISERAIQVAVLFERDGERFVQLVIKRGQINVHFERYAGNPHDLEVRDLDAENKGHLYAVGGYQVKLKDQSKLEALRQVLAESYSLLN